MKISEETRDFLIYFSEYKSSNFIQKLRPHDIAAICILAVKKILQECAEEKKGTWQNMLYELKLVYNKNKRAFAEKLKE
jgi:hypothetical protein